MATSAKEKLDLSLAFTDKNSCKTFFKEFAKRLPADAAISVLALEGMFRLEQDQKFAFYSKTKSPSTQRLHGIVQKWFERLGNKKEGVDLANCLMTLKHSEFDFTKVSNLPFDEEEEYTDLLEWFTNPTEENKATMFQSLDRASQIDPLVAVLALQGLHCIGNDFVPGKIGLNDCIQTNNFRDLLRRWRCDSRYLYYEEQDKPKYSRPKRPVIKVLRALTIFTVLEVPLFIDNYGHKAHLTCYEETEEIDINGDTPICHVTHQATADKILKERAFKSSNDKNSIPGVWFGFMSGKSNYGTVSFKTKLSRLGVTGLHQGEIVVYKLEVNVILYADRNGGSFKGLRKPTASALRGKHGDFAYIHVSVFVPDPSPVWTEWFNVRHTDICVPALRKTFEHDTCPEQMKDKKRLEKEKEDLETLFSKLEITSDSEDS